MPYNLPARPLVSVVVPCYNDALYLRNAIESVLLQTYRPMEVIVVNDGSTDETEKIARSFSDVLYIYQQNQGLSAARNAGVLAAHGEYVVFLDADDVLYHDAISTNLQYLMATDAAFVSGGHVKKDVVTGLTMEQPVPLDDNHYRHLLQGNYIGMHAAVMYRKSIFDTWRFDPSLRVCEDYDLYLQIARQSPVLHHTTAVAEYRMRSESLSADMPLMLQAALSVLERQRRKLQSPQEHEAYRAGRRAWKNYYGQKMLTRLLVEPELPPVQRKNFLRSLWKYKPGLYFRYLFTKSGLISKPG